MATAAVCGPQPESSLGGPAQPLPRGIRPVPGQYVPQPWPEALRGLRLSHSLLRPGPSTPLGTVSFPDSPVQSVPSFPSLANQSAEEGRPCLSRGPAWDPPIRGPSACSRLVRDSRPPRSHGAGWKPLSPPLKDTPFLVLGLGTLMSLLPTLTAQRPTSRGVQKPQHKCTHTIYTPATHVHTPRTPENLTHSHRCVPHQGPAEGVCGGSRAPARTAAPEGGRASPHLHEGPGSPAEALAAPTEESAPSGPLRTVRAQDPRATSSPPHWKSLSHVGFPHLLMFRVA